MSGSLDTSDILVVIDKGDQYTLSLQPPDQYGISIKSGDTYIVNIDLPTTIVTNQTDSYYRIADFASSALSASYALTASYISGAAGTWDTIANKPPGLVSSSTQVDYTQIQNQPTLIASASVALTASYVSGAASTWDTIANKPAGLVSSSTQVKNYNIFATTGSNIFNDNQTISGSITFNGGGKVLPNYQGQSGSIDLKAGPGGGWAELQSNNEAQYIWVDDTGAYIGTNYDTASRTWLFDRNGTLTVPGNIVGADNLATTGSNTFTDIQTISNTTNSTLFNNGALIVQGGVGITKDVNISGSLKVIGLLTAISMSTQYVTSSQYVLGDNKIILNSDDLVRFGGMSVVDSGSTAATASIYWDSLNHHFIYENISSAPYNSAIIIAGPKNIGALGNEPELIVGRIPVATGGDHIDNRLASSSIRVDFPSRLTHVEAGLQVTGSITSSAGFSGDGSQITGIVTSSFATTASAATSITFTPLTASFAISSSRATTSSFAITSSFVTTASFAISSSRAISSSFATTASYAANADTLDGINSTTFATTGSNIFNGNQTITGSLITNADTLIFTGSIFTSGSMSVIGATITGSLFGTASRATTASYALTASFIDGGFY